MKPPNSLFWIFSTLVSVFTLKYYQTNGDLPGYEALDSRTANIDPDKAAFSMAPHDEEAYAPIHNNDHEDDDHRSNVHNPYSADAYGSVNSNTMFDSETAYNSHGGGSQAGQADPFADNAYGAQSHTGGGGYSDNMYNSGANPYGGSQVGGSSIYAPPTAEESYDDGRPAKFPTGNYDRTGVLAHRD